MRSFLMSEQLSLESHRIAPARTDDFEPQAHLLSVLLFSPGSALARATQLVDSFRTPHTDSSSTLPRLSVT